MRGGTLTVLAALGVMPGAAVADSVWIDSAEVLVTGVDATVVQAEYRLSQGGWDASLDNGSGTGHPAWHLADDLGANDLLSGRAFDFTLEHVADQGFIYTIDDGAGLVRTFWWGDFAIAPAGEGAVELGGAVPGAAYNALRFEARAQRAGSSFAFMNLAFASPTLAIADGAFDAGTVTPATAGEGDAPGTWTQRLVADVDLVEHDWTLSGTIVGTRDATSVGDELVRVLVAGEQVEALIGPGCDLPGRPAADGSGDRVVRGFIVGWASTLAKEEIRWNHLSATATVIDYRDGTAWEYPSTNAIAVDDSIPTGGLLEDQGTLRLDGVEYGVPPSVILMNFQAAGSGAYSTSAETLVSDTELVLLPLDLDLRPDETEGPTRTVAIFDVWNENEIKFSGAHRCVVCWDATALFDYGTPNHFRIDTLQTDQGVARVNGEESPLCPDVTVPAAMIGIAARRLDSGAGAFDVSGTVLIGAGAEPATMRHRGELPPPPEAGGATATRISTTDKGSLFILGHVEVRYDATGAIVRDTFITLTNDHPESVRVLMHFVNGEGELYEEACDRWHPGWNFSDVSLTLTGNQPVRWSAATGEPVGVSPFKVLDP